MDEPLDPELGALVGEIPEGWSRVRVSGQTWGVTRTTRVNGRVVSISAERLSDTEQISANVWHTANSAVLKPCEVPGDAVVRFLRAVATRYSA